MSSEGHWKSWGRVDRAVTNEHPMLSLRKPVEMERVERATSIAACLNYQLPYTTRTCFLGLTYSLRLLKEGEGEDCVSDSSRGHGCPS